MEIQESRRLMAALSDLQKKYEAQRIAQECYTGFHLFSLENQELDLRSRTDRGVWKQVQSQCDWAIEHLYGTSAERLPDLEVFAAFASTLLASTPVYR